MTSQVPSTCTHASLNSSPSTSTLTCGSRRALAVLARSGYVEIDQPTLLVDSPAHRAGLRAPVLAPGDQHEVVARAYEVEQLVELDAVGGGDGPRHASTPPHAPNPCRPDAG